MFKINELMTSPVYSLRETDTLQSARVLMEKKRIRHVPIIASDNAFRGLITNRDVLANTISHLANIDPATQDEIDAGIPLQEIMRTDVHTITPDHSVREAAHILYNHKYGCLPVVDGGKLVGIISDRDMYRILVEITGARRGGVRVSLPVDDRPGSIREVGDIVRAHGFRLQSILSSNDKAAPGQRYVVLRIFGNGDQQNLKKELDSKYQSVRFKGS